MTESYTRIKRDNKKMNEIKSWNRVKECSKYCGKIWRTFKTDVSDNWFETSVIMYEK